MTIKNMTYKYFFIGMLFIFTCLESCCQSRDYPCYEYEYQYEGENNYYFYEKENGDSWEVLININNGIVNWRACSHPSYDSKVEYGCGFLFEENLMRDSSISNITHTFSVLDNKIYKNYRYPEKHLFFDFGTRKKYYYLSKAVSTRFLGKKKQSDGILTYLFEKKEDYKLFKHRYFFKSRIYFSPLFGITRWVDYDKKGRIIRDIRLKKINEIDLREYIRADTCVIKPWCDLGNP